MAAHRRVVLGGALLATIGVIAAGCADDGSSANAGRLATTEVSGRPTNDAFTSVSNDPTPGPVRLAFVGDIMLGRNVAPVVESDPSSVFERLRPAIVGADLAFANLESPLTTRTHVDGAFALEADPAAAELLGSAGFDVVGIANNHASDAGLTTIADTTSAVEAAGLVAVGGGTNVAAARAPYIVDVGGVRVGIIAVDMSGARPATDATAGVAVWDPETVHAALRALRPDVDIIVAGIHGGVEYLPRPDPVLRHATELLAEWGADVVWGHGAHVAYPVEVVSGGRDAIIAPGLGNALFDQRLPDTQAGTLLEVLADGDGVIAMRTGRIAIDASRTAFTGWDMPSGDAAALDGDWWTPVRPWSPAPLLPAPDDDPAFPAGRTENARAAGDVLGSGSVDLVISYRRPARDERIHDAFPDIDWIDEFGRSAHLAVYAEDGHLRWASAFMLQPVGAVAACDGSLALGFTALDVPDVVAGGAWVWDGFGFRTAPVLPGAAEARCADIDLDGRTDPVLVRLPPD